MKKSFIASLTSIIGFFLISMNVSAQATISGAKEGVTNLSTLVTTITTSLVSALGTLMLAAAVVAFFWGVVQYVWGVREGVEAKIKAGNQFMLWGLIALFVMFSVYGIIQVAQSLIPGLDKTTIKIPRIDFGTSDGPSSNSLGNPSPNTQSEANPFGTPPTPNTSNSNRGSLGNPTPNTSAGSNGGANYDSRRTGIADFGCSTRNGGTCRSGGLPGTCSDFNCITSDSTSPPAEPTVSCPDGSSSNGSTCIPDPAP